MGSLGGDRDLLEEPDAVPELGEDGVGDRVARELLFGDAGEVVEADGLLRRLVQGGADVGAPSMCPARRASAWRRSRLSRRSRELR
jgi:hypothetical protein